MFLLCQSLINGNVSSLTLNNIALEPLSMLHFSRFYHTYFIDEKSA
jgi:hypothetical protein